MEKGGAETVKMKNKCFLVRFEMNVWMKHYNRLCFAKSTLERPGFTRNNTLTPALIIIVTFQKWVIDQAPEVSIIDFSLQQLLRGFYLAFSIQNTSSSNSAMQMKDCGFHHGHHECNISNIFVGTCLFYRLQDGTSGRISSLSCSLKSYCCENCPH